MVVVARWPEKKPQGEKEPDYTMLSFFWFIF